MRHILNSHPDVAICAENHYLGHLLPSQGVRHVLRRFGDLHDDANVDALVAFIYDGGLDRASRVRAPSRLWTWVTTRLSPDELRDRLLRGERSERGVFSAVMDAYAGRRGATVRGEKTPAHLRFVDTLLAWYPEGRVLHMMRDPRAVFVSELRRRKRQPGALPYRLLSRIGPLLTLFVLFETTIIWAEGAWRHSRFRRAYPDRYRLIHFEALVREPQREIASICEFAGIPYDPVMLEQTVVSHGVELGARGIDPGAADRWRQAIPSWADAWFRRLLGQQMRAVGYLAEP